MKKATFIIYLIFCAINARAYRVPDSFICYQNRKIEITADQYLTHPWQERNIEVVLDREKRQITIFAKQTVTLSMIGEESLCITKWGDTSRTITAIDQRGVKCECLITTFKKRVGADVITLVLRYQDVLLVYLIKRE